MTTPKSNHSEHYKQFREAVALAIQDLELCRQCRSGRDRFYDFRPEFGFWHKNAMSTVKVILPSISYQLLDEE